MNWIKNHWQPLAWILGIFTTCVVYGGEEIMTYVNMKEAVLQQKLFNTEYESRFNSIEKDISTIQATQQRLDERSIRILDSLGRIEGRLHK
jgi:hypothetical protein